MGRIKKIMGSRFAGFFCFVFAIANRIVFTSLYSLIGADTKLQLVYAKNLLAGKGMGVTKYFSTDPDTPVFDTQQMFPPGFSFTIIPFLQIFGGDEYKAVHAYDIVAAILFILAARILGRKAGLSPLWNNIFTLIAGCSQYFFFMSWSSTDVIGVCLVMFGLIKTIGIISKKDKIGWLEMLVCGFLFFAPFFFRFMYLPMVLLLPILILLSGFFLRTHNLKITGIGVLLVSAGLLIAFFVFSLHTTGNALYIMSQERGFFPAQLDLCHPFFPASFINIDFGAQLIESVFGIGYSRVMVFLKLLNALMFIVFVFLFIRYLTVRLKTRLIPDHSAFIIVGSLISLAIILLIVYLSVTYKELTWGFYRWVHGWEARYYAFIYVFVPLLFIVCIHHYKTSLKRPLIRFFVFIGLCLLGTEVLHGIYYNLKILVVHKDLAYIRDSDKSFKRFPVILKDIQKQNPNREVIVCSPDNFYLHTAVQIGHKAIFDYSQFLQNGIKPSSNTILLMPIQTQDVAIIEEFVKKYEPRLIMEIAGTSYYMLEIGPD